MGESVRMLRSLEKKVSESLQDLEVSRKLRTVRGTEFGDVFRTLLDFSHFKIIIKKIYPLRFKCPKCLTNVILTGLTNDGSKMTKLDLNLK